MNRVEQILNQILDGFKANYKIKLKDIHKAQEQTALEFTKWKDENYVTYKIRGLWDGKFYAKNADYWASKGKTSEQLFNEWNNLNNKQQTT